MKSYSPVDNVKAQEYPYILVTAGLNDPRVMYSEHAKFVTGAENRRQPRAIQVRARRWALLQVGEIWEIARSLTYAFILKSLGMTPPRKASGNKAEQRQAQL